MSINLTVKELSRLFQEKLIEVEEEPEFHRGTERLKYALDTAGAPLVKLAIGNVPLDYDLWQGLRNPAVIGFYPAGLPELWDYYANRRKSKYDEAGRPSIFQVLRPYEFARQNYSRAVIISVMLPFSPEIVSGYVEQIVDKKKGSSHMFARMYEDLNRIIDKATTRAAIELTDEDKMVLAMNGDTVNTVSKEAVPPTHQDASHGPSKGGNFPQKSLAVLVGLGQFGVSRIVFRDELSDGKVQRFAGPIRSIVIFDKQELVTDGSDGVFYPTQALRDFIFKLSDFTNIDPEINKHRFCTYIPMNDKGCGKCIENCPSGALVTSSCEPNGSYSERVTRQAHRFWEGKLQFDFGKCCDERGQLAGLLPEWSCARCVTICLDRGNRRKQAAQNFYDRMIELTRQPVTV